MSGAIVFAACLAAFLGIVWLVSEIIVRGDKADAARLEREIFAAPTSFRDVPVTKPPDRKAGGEG